MKKSLVLPFIQRVIENKLVSPRWLLISHIWDVTVFGDDLSYSTPEPNGSQYLTNFA